MTLKWNDEKALKFILDALNIQTNLPLNDIGYIYKGKCYEKGLLGAIKLCEDKQNNK